MLIYTTEVWSNETFQLLHEINKAQFHNIVTILSDYRRVLDWQSDLLHFTTKYNWVSPDSLSLTLHNWIYHTIPQSS
jgi:hypothetical protein